MADNKWYKNMLICFHCKAQYFVTECENAWDIEFYIYSLYWLILQLMAPFLLYVQHMYNIYEMSHRRFSNNF